MFSGIGMQELLVILLIVLLVFGAKRIPEVARGLGRGIREFKKATREMQDEISQEDEEREKEKKELKG